MIQIMIVDDHAMVRDGIKLVLEREQDIQIVKETGSGGEAIEFLRKNKAHVVLLDITLPDKNGIEVLREIHRDHNDVSVLMISMHAEERFGVRAIEAGASGYLSKGSAADELVKAIRKIHRGGKYISSSLADELAMEVHHETEVAERGRLSDREFSIMLMIGAGESRAEIARRLNLSPATISTYRKRILSKLNLESNADLFRYVVDNHLLG